MSLLCSGRRTQEVAQQLDAVVVRKDLRRAMADTSTAWEDSLTTERTLPNRTGRISCQTRHRSLRLAPLRGVHRTTQRSCGRHLDTAAPKRRPPKPRSATDSRSARGTLGDLGPLTVTFDHLHALHGGLQLTIRGDGTIEQRALRMKAGEPKEKVARGAACAYSRTSSNRSPRRATCTTTSVPPVTTTVSCSSCCPACTTTLYGPGGSAAARCPATPCATCVPFTS